MARLVEHIRLRGELRSPRQASGKYNEDEGLIMSGMSSGTLLAEKDKETYEKPMTVKETKMTFPRIILTRGKQVVCRQCSSCHGCR